MFVLARLATRLPETPKSQSLTSPLVFNSFLVVFTSWGLDGGFSGVWGGVVEWGIWRDRREGGGPRWMMLRLSLRYFRPRTVQLVTQASMFSSRMPLPAGTSLSKLPPSICDQFPSKLALESYVFHANKHTRFREKATVKVNDQIRLRLMQNLPSASIQRPTAPAQSGEKQRPEPQKKQYRCRKHKETRRDEDL